jgi:hypothetical protein
MAMSVWFKMPCVTFLWRTHPWVVPLQGMVKKPKVTNHFPKPFLLYMFTTIIYLFSCLSIACTNIWLEVYFGIKKLEVWKSFATNVICNLSFATRWIFSDNCCL